MCGIFGIVTERPVDEALGAARAALGALTHRGPDDEGIEVVSRPGDPLAVVFGHRRLSILDLSAAGHQPMRDEATGNWITYNGEVFNFREVRRQLERRGLEFRSESDTEVILKGMGLMGASAAGDWRGMFALGFWDAGRRRLKLLRDRLGIKPLYYYRRGSTLLFASEVRALLATGLVQRTLSRAAVDSYLGYGAVEQPLTIVEDVYELLPGHAMSFDGSSPRMHAYWEIAAAASAAPERDRLREEMGALLLESVRLRMVSDVPVGVFLSGGIDSSAIVSLMRRAVTGEIRTFSVCFGEEEFSEREYAETVAARYGASHQSLPVTAGEILAKLPAAIGAMDQPTIDGINSYIVSEAASRAGLKVAISGLGGDEVFCGYGYYRGIARSERMRSVVGSLPAGLRHAAAAAIVATSGGQRAGRLGALLRSDHLEEHSVRLHRMLFTGEQRRRLMGERSERQADIDLVAAWNRRQLANCAGADPVNQASALDLGGYLSDMLLRDTDSMSMAHGLEVRVPLIDHLVVEKALSIPGPVKLAGDTPKWILVEAAGDLPDKVVRRPKRGFELPFEHWLKGELRPRVEEALGSSRLGAIIDPAEAGTVWHSFLDGRMSWARAWSLFVLGEWMETNL